MKACTEKIRKAFKHPFIPAEVNRLVGFGPIHWADLPLRRFHINRSDNGTVKVVCYYRYYALNIETGIVFSVSLTIAAPVDTLLATPATPLHYVVDYVIPRMDNEMGVLDAIAEIKPIKGHEPVNPMSNDQVASDLLKAAIRSSPATWESA